jgi:hypothetical protein
MADPNPQAPSDNTPSPAPAPPPSGPVSQDPAPTPRQNPLLVTPTDGDLGKLSRPTLPERDVIKMVVPEDPK